ncbi:hypothetical protein [Longirhabdus pacifica]|uniref:hypothetical protein n=1 Tax=Longirhabdus pacifica TaxID=2305227 RepID=UPI0010091D34|nr:hypothetical protein [Longirhabdus pacifica]
MIRNKVKVSTQTFRVRQTPDSGDPCGDTCCIFDNNPCGGNCTLCVLIIPIPNNAVCIGSVTITNANVTLNRRGALSYTPSKNYQITMVTTPRKNCIKLTTFVYPNVKNNSRKSFMVQVVDEKGKLINSKIPFALIRKIKRKARMRARTMKRNNHK